MLFFIGANDSGNNPPADDHARSTLNGQPESDLESDDKEDDDDSRGKALPNLQTVCSINYSPTCA